MDTEDTTLVLIRHGESEWNKKNLFTGWKDPSLSNKGQEEAISAGKALKREGYTFDKMFTSDLVRAQQTGELILEQINQSGLETIKDKALNERNYGDLVGLNKDEARKKWGEDQVHKWRRSYETRPPGGESLKDTAERVLPYFHKNIVPLLKKREKILITAHGNSLRALTMYLDSLTPEEIVKVELKTGVLISYKVGSDGVAKNKSFIIS